MWRRVAPSRGRARGQRFEKLLPHVGHTRRHRWVFAVSSPEPKCCSLSASSRCQPSETTFQSPTLQVAVAKVEAAKKVAAEMIGHSTETKRTLATKHSSQRQKQINRTVVPVRRCSCNWHSCVCVCARERTHKKHTFPRLAIQTLLLETP